MRELFFAAVGTLTGILLLVGISDWFIQITREPYSRIEDDIDAYIRSLCDDPEGRER